MVKRSHDLALPWQLALSVPTFVIGLVMTRLVHVAGHLIGAWQGGAKILGFYSPLFGRDLAYLEYPTAAWSGQSQALPYLLGGAGACLVLAILIVYLWPPSFGVAARLVPHLLGAILLIHGVVEPLADFSPRGENGLASDLLGSTPILTWAVVAGLSLALVAHVLLRSCRLAGTVSDLELPSRRFAFALLFWTIPEILYVTVRTFLLPLDVLDFAFGMVAALGPALAVLAASTRLFHQRVDRFGLPQATAVAWVAAPLLLGLWWFAFAGFHPPMARGIVWGEPGPFNNIREETPARHPAELRKMPKLPSFSKSSKS